VEEGEPREGTKWLYRPRPRREGNRLTTQAGSEGEWFNQVTQSCAPGEWTAEGLLRELRQVWWQ
jgi:hypothetical protein